MSDAFLSREPQPEDYWRAIVLFGRNVACYKFALAKTLLQIRPESGQLIKLDELAPRYAKNISEHLLHAATQGTSRSSTFLDGCRKFNSGESTELELRELTLRHGFNNVVDAFHVVGQGNVACQFFVDERNENNGIRITDEFSALMARQQAGSLPGEVEARWNLVEAAWGLQIARSLVTIQFEGASEALYTLDSQRRRKPLTGCREALNGYQKGKCFYCFADISIGEPQAIPDTEVDHFFPPTLKHRGLGSIVDGVWNLVLSCQRCNRGVGGKFASLPTIKLLQRLDRRNEFLIASHHPLRETLMHQTGQSAKQRKLTLNDYHNRARAVLIHLWEAEEVAAAAF